MKKYWTVFQLSFQNEFTYRLNFVLWRFRNVLRILMTYFLWNSIFSQNKIAFGYTKEQMMTYVFSVLVVLSFIISSPSNDNMGGEISSGDLSNFLAKPINYINYWLTRDWASKLLNIIFSFLEIGILWFIIRPNLQIVTNPAQILMAIIACLVAVLTYFYLSKLAVFVAFWAPENTWTAMFMILVFLEILSGSIFPLNILPSYFYNLVQFTPFPFLVYFPIGIFVGKFSLGESLIILFKSSLWLIFSYTLSRLMWKSGLKVYSASGK